MSVNGDQHTAIIIAAYNAQATLDRAIASALAEPEVAEVCVVDDKSSDATPDLALAWAARDARVKLVRQPENSGPASARNAAFAATTAPWIAILDADDYFLPGRLAKLHAHAGEADFIADALQRTVEGATPPPPSEPLAPRPMGFAEFVLGDHGRQTGPLDLGFLKPMFRRAFIDTHRLHYRDGMRLGEDYVFYAQALALGARFLLCNSAGYASVERPGSLSKTHSEADLLRLRQSDEDLARLRIYSTEERRAINQHWNSVDCRLQWRLLINAVKACDAGAALKTFHTPQAALYLAARLGEQIWLRGALRRRPGDAGKAPAAPALRR